MNRTAISILFAFGFALLVVGGVIYFGGAQNLMNCPRFSCGLAVNRETLGLFVTAAAFYLPGVVLLLIAWITVLIKQAQRRQWAWFICTLFFRDITMLLWLILEPEVSSVSSARGRYR